MQRVQQKAAGNFKELEMDNYTYCVRTAEANDRATVATLLW